MRNSVRFKGLAAITVFCAAVYFVLGLFYSADSVNGSLAYLLINGLKLSRLVVANSL